MVSKLQGLLFMLPLIAFHIGGLIIMIQDWKISKSQRQFIMVLAILLLLFGFGLKLLLT